MTNRWFYTQAQGVLKIIRLSTKYQYENVDCGLPEKRADSGPATHYAIDACVCAAYDPGYGHVHGGGGVYPCPALFYRPSLCRPHLIWQ